MSISFYGCKLSIVLNMTFGWIVLIFKIFHSFVAYFFISLEDNESLFSG